MSQDPSGCVFNLSVWDAEYQLASILSTIDQAPALEISYNAIVNIPLAGFREAFTFSKTNGTDGSLNTVFKIDTTAITAHMFAPFSKGTVMDVTNLTGYGGVVPQNSINFGSAVPPITGPTHPIFSDGSVQTSLNSAASVATRSYADASNNRIASDYLGFLGYQCFGNSSACNLFSDTTVTAYAGELPANDTDFIAKVDTMLRASTVDADQYDPLTGELFADLSQQSLCYVLYHQLMDLAPGRFDPLSTEYSLVNVPDTQDDWYLPVVEGDVMQCTLTMKAHTDQSLFGQPTHDSAAPVAIEDRVYLIRFVVGNAAPKDGNSVNTDLVHDSPEASL